MNQCGLIIKRNRSIISVMNVLQHTVSHMHRKSEDAHVVNSGNVSWNQNLVQKFLSLLNILDRWRLNMLNTKRLNLRKFKHEDMDFLYELDNDKEVNKYRSSSNRTLKFCKNQITNWNKQYDTIEHNVYLLEEKKSMDKIGLAFLVKPEQVYFLGYRLIKDAWRNGFGYEACLKLIEMHFKVEKEPIYAETHPNNQASINLLFKLGFDEIIEDEPNRGRMFKLSREAWKVSGLDSR